MRRVGAIALTTLALAGAACTPGAPTRVGSPPPIPARSPKAGATPKPPPGAATPTPGPSAAAAAGGTTLKAPAGAHVRLAGRVTVDAGYALAQGGRALAGDAILVAGAGGAIVSNNGGRLLGDQGGSLIVDARGGVLGLDGRWLARIISDNGGGLVANNGAGIISDNGGGIISDKGGGVVGNHGGSYRLAQAAPAPAFGEARPAAGMFVSVVDLRTGRTLPLGVDAAGRPIHTIATDPAGAFEAYLPPDAAAHTRVVARAPGGGDARLALGAFLDGAAAGTEVAVDPDVALAASYLRLVTAARIEAGFAANPPALPAYQALSPARRQELAALLGDKLLAAVDFPAVKTTFVGRKPVDPAGAEVDEGKPARDVLTSVLRELREAARADAAGRPDPAAWLADRPWVHEANLARPPEARLRVERPADVPDLVVRAHLLVEAPGVNPARRIFADLGLPPSAWDRASAASVALQEAIVTSAVALDFAADSEGSLGALLRELAPPLAEATPAPAPIGPFPAVPPRPTPPALTVSTVAGLPGTKGIISGSGAASRFAALAGIAWLDKPFPALYVGDAHHVRRLRIGADGAVTTEIVAGAANQAGFVDGPGATARFKLVSGLAADPQGRLVVTERGNFAVRRVAFDAAGAATVETLAGMGTEGEADGPGATASFKNPLGPAVAPDGDVWLADQGLHKLRKIALGDPARTVSTAAGTGELAPREGPLLAANVPGPTGVLFDPQGRLLFLHGGVGSVRMAEAPLAPGARTRLLAGGNGREEGDWDGFWAGARLGHPLGGALDAQGRLIFCESQGTQVRALWPSGWVTTLADGFVRPYGAAVAPDGTIYVIDPGDFTVKALR